MRRPHERRDAARSAAELEGIDGIVSTLVRLLYEEEIAATIIAAREGRPRTVMSLSSVAYAAISSSYRRRTRIDTVYAFKPKCAPGRGTTLVTTAHFLLFLVVMMMTTPQVNDPPKRLQS